MITMMLKMLMIMIICYFFCDYPNCDKIFNDKKSRYKHLWEHQKLYKCSFEICNKSFSKKRDLLIHEKIHQRCQKIYLRKNCCKHLFILIFNRIALKEDLLRKINKPFNFDEESWNSLDVNH